MNHYLFTFDINVNSSVEQRHVEEFLCNLNKNEGFEVKELKPSTTYILSHQDQKNVFLKSRLTIVMADTGNAKNRWVLCQISTEADGSPRTTDKGIDIQCP